MKMKKRNLIVAALVIALGAAVYLNWQFGGDNTLLTSSTKELGAAEYVNNDITVTSPSKTKLSSKQSNYFADARTKREQSQDKVVDIAKEVLEKSDSSTDSKESAKAQAEKIPYMVVIGDKEVENGTISVRDRFEGDLGTWDQQKLMEIIKEAQI